MSYVKPENKKMVPCRKCGRLVFMLIVNGESVPIDPDGTAHRMTCPKRRRR